MKDTKIERFRENIARLGADVEQWPGPERGEAGRLLDGSAEAQAVLRRQQEIETLLKELPAPPFNGLQDRVLNQGLPPRQASPLDRLLRWLIPEPGSTTGWWRPLTAACLPLVFGILVGNFFSFGIARQELTFAYWEDELAMLSLTEISLDTAQP